MCHRGSQNAKNSVTYYSNAALGLISNTSNAKTSNFKCNL